jgi:plasmid stability protein
VTDTDLLLDLDYELFAAIAARAATNDRTMEEEAVRLLYLAYGLPEEPPPVIPIEP